MFSNYVKTILLEAVIFCIVLDTILTGTVNSTKPLENVNANCKKKLDFKSIKEFKAFIQDLKTISTSNKSPLLSLEEEKLFSYVKRCLDEKESLFELERLIDNYDKERACKFSEITKLENYIKKYIKNNNKLMAIKFFTLFGVNIGFICKLNLLANIKQAESEVEQLDFIYSMASPTGWNVLINEHTKKSMKFGLSSHGNDVINRVAKLVPGLTQIDQLNYLEFNHNNDFKSGEFKFKDNIQTNGGVVSKVHENFEQIVEACKNLDKFYVNLTLSLAKLNYLGLVVSFDVINRYHESSAMLHKWLAATSFCQLLARVKVKPRPKEEPIIKFEIVNNESLLHERRKLYSYVTKIDEIHQQAIDNVWAASLTGGQWNRKSGGNLQSDQVEQLRQFLRGLEKDYLSSVEN